ncbi:hypothetical protein BJ741DRAFT_637700 [Chytriomyces cf. hyalinus JEL632]|nr:hypothetical protein BJ741DRAFT_637700 [Chytriomyces cf. hyalinus JEL632]
MPRHLELPVSMPVSNHREHANSSADQLARHRPPVPKQSSSGQQDESFSINSAWNGEAPALHSYENRPADTVSAESGIASFESGVRSRSILMDSDRAFSESLPVPAATKQRTHIPHTLPYYSCIHWVETVIGRYVHVLFRPMRSVSSAHVLNVFSSVHSRQGDQSGEKKHERECSPFSRFLPSIKKKEGGQSKFNAAAPPSSFYTCTDLKLFARYRQEDNEAGNPGRRVGGKQTFGYRSKSASC